jgi:hypothetical protein
LTRSSGCLRTVSWRTEGLGAALLAIALLAAAPAAAQGMTVSAAMHGQRAEARVSFTWDREAELVSFLRGGLESRITFTVRLFRQRPSLLPVLGETLLAERIVSRSAYFDILEKKFVMETDDGARALFDLPEDLLRAYFRLEALPLAAVRSSDKPSVAAQVRFEAVRLMPPLSIVSLAGAAASTVSPWVRARVAGL